MNKYKVRVTRQTVADAIVEVNAENPTEAAEVAEQQVADMDFSTYESIRNVDPNEVDEI
jgi:hypothetical protein